MTFPKIRLIIAAVLLAGWLGYLGYLAATTSNPIVLSRPQFLVSSAIVIAEVKSKDQRPDPVVTVKEVVWDPSQTLKANAALEVQFVPKSGFPLGWEGGGSYILAISKRANGTYSITPLPPSPGYPGLGTDSAERYRIYPETPRTVQQLQEILETQKSSPFAN